MKAKCNSWESTTEAAYVDPKLQLNPALRANVDVTVDETHSESKLAPLDQYMCSLRPRQRVHPSLVQADRKAAQSESEKSKPDICRRLRFTKEAQRKVIQPEEESKSYCRPLRWFQYSPKR